MSWIYKRDRSPYYWWAAWYKGRKLRKSTKMTQRRLAQRIQHLWDMALVEGDLSFIGISGTNKTKDPGIQEFVNTFVNLRERKSASAFETAKSTTVGFLQYLKEKNVDSIQDIKLNILDGYIDWLTCAPKTKKNHVGIIKLMLDQAVKEGYLERNYAVDVTLPKIVKEDRYRLLDPNDLTVIFENAGKWKLYYSFLYYTGLRAGDVSRLKYSNIDRDKKAIISLVRKSRRVHQLPLADELLKLIPNKHGKSPLFPNLFSENERKVRDKLAKPRKYLQKILKEKNRPKATLHSFRKTYNNLLRDLGLGIEDRRILLAHSASETTKIYTVPNFELASEYVNKIPKVNAE